MFWPEFGRYGRVWSPWREMERLQQDVNRLLSQESTPYATTFPAVNIWASEQDVIVTAEVPASIRTVSISRSPRTSSS